MANHTDLSTNQNDDFFTLLGNTFRLIGESWRAVQHNLMPFILLYLIAPLFFMAALITVLGITPSANGTSIEFNPSNGILAAVAVFGILIMAVVIAIALILTQLASVHGKKVTTFEVIDNAMQYFWKMIGLGVLSFVFVIVGFMFFLVPGLLAIFFLTFASYVLIDKNTSILTAMRQSYVLTRKNWKIILALYVVQAVISLPNIIPGVGAVLTLALGIAYLCLPAILYVRISQTTAKFSK